MYPGSQYWAISFARRPDGVTRVEIEGPSLAARTVESVEGEEYWGVELAAHVMLRGAPKDSLLGGVVTILAKDGAVAAFGGRWPVPAYDALEEWVQDRIADGALVVDDETAAALAGDRTGATARTWQRRFRRTVGLTAANVEQLKRAEHAFALLQAGFTPPEAAATAGFSDQSHLTRSLRLIRGRTPASILSAVRARSE
ncbi:MAG: helix-turn-helix domain-containing protein [Propionibacteriaceae bacterium]|nr:helix-turn-helix domain-containing protein [Propionibacteriaceae bacterium]